MANFKGKNKEVRNYLIYKDGKVRYGKVKSQSLSVGEKRPSIALRTTDRDCEFENMFAHYALAKAKGSVLLSVNRIIKDTEILNELDGHDKVDVQIYDDVTDICFRGEIIEIHTSGSRDSKILCPNLELCPEHLKHNAYMTWLKVINLRPVPTLDKSKFEKLHPNKYTNLGQLEGKRWEFVYVIEN